MHDFSLKSSAQIARLQLTREKPFGLFWPSVWLGSNRFWAWMRVPVCCACLCIVGTYIYVRHGGEGTSWQCWCVCVYVCMLVFVFMFALCVCVYMYVCYWCLYTCTYIYKQELKTVVHELLACTQPYSHETFTALGTPTVECPRGGNMRKYTSAEWAHGKKPENDHPPFWFYGESIRTSIFNNTTTTQHLIRQRQAVSATYISLYIVICWCCSNITGLELYCKVLHLVHCEKVLHIQCFNYIHTLYHHCQVNTCHLFIQSECFVQPNEGGGYIVTKTSELL